MELQGLDEKGAGKKTKEKGLVGRRSTYSKLMRSSWRTQRVSRPSTASIRSLGNKGISTPLHDAVNKCDIEEVKNILKHHNRAENIDSHDAFGLSPLHYAAKRGFDEIILTLIEHEVSISQKCKTGNTPLHTAIRYHQEDAALLLIDHGANPVLLDMYGLNALHLAAMENMPTVIEKLLEKKLATIDAQDIGQMNTALHFAVIENNIKICKILLGHGAAPDICNSAGETPLHLVANVCDLEIIDVLISSFRRAKQTSGQVGSEVELSIRSYVNRPRLDTKTPVLLAAQMGNQEVLNELIRERADIFISTSNKASILHLAAASGNKALVEDMASQFVREGLSMNSTDNKQRTPLHEAVHQGHTGVVKVLLGFDPNLEVKDNDGDTPILCAVKNNHTDIARLLIQQGSNTAAKDKNLKTGLHHAIETENDELAILMLEASKKLVHTQDEDSRTPVHYAARFDNAKILALLMRQPIDLNQVENTGETALHVAARYGNVSCVSLLSKGAEPEVIDCDNPEKQTPLHLAVIRKQPVSCKVLLKQKADMNCSDRDGWTPLHHAALQEDTNIMAILLRYNADVDSEDDCGNTALMVAAKAGNVLGVVMLLDNGASVDLTNQDGDTFFDLAIDYQQELVCKAVLDNERWKEVLSCKDPNGARFMSRLVEKYPKLVELILDRSTIFSDHHPDHPDLSVTFDYQFLEEDPKSEGFWADSASLFMKHRNMLYFSPQLICQYGRERLMSHPITSSICDVKWQRICKYLYYFSLFFYMVYVVSLTTLVIMEGRQYVKVTVQRGKNRTKHRKTYDDDLRRIEDDGPANKLYAKILAPIIMIFCGVQILKVLVQLIVLRKKFFKNFANYVEVTLYTVSLLYITRFMYARQVTKALSELGVIVIFLGWSNCLLYLQRVPMFRLYIVMFLKVAFTIVKLLFVFSIIILAFALTFYLLFIRQTSFRNPLASLTKVLVMMTGEFDYETAISTNLGAKDSKTNFPLVPFPTMSYCIFVIFVFFVAVAFTNLLVGLAVGDIDKIQNLATVTIFERQLQLIDTIQGIVPKYILKKYVYVSTYSYQVNKKTRLQRFADTFSTSSFDEDLKKLRMQQLDFDARRITCQSTEKSLEQKLENKKYKLLEKLLLDQKRMIKSIVEETVNGKKEEGKN